MCIWLNKCTKNMFGPSQTATIKRSMLQKSPRTTKNCQRKPPWRVAGGTQNGLLGVTRPPQNGLLVQKHTNVAKKNTRTSIWLSQDTPKTAKSMHFAKDILSKIKDAQMPLSRSDKYPKMIPETLPDDLPKAPMQLR